MVSIIVPLYNVENYVDKCIESLVNQTFSDIEIILIDDGSMDTSKEKCLNWLEKDNRIIYVRKKNEGQGSARNLGINMAKGEYIAFVDSDDWLERDAIENMYKAAERSGADIVTANINYVLIDDEGNCNKTVSALRIKEDTLINIDSDISLINKCRLFLCGKLYKKSVILNSKVQQPRHAFEDTVAVPALIAQAQTIYHINKVVYNYYRNRVGNTVNNIKLVYYMERSLDELQSIFKGKKLFDKYYEALKRLSYGQVRYVYKMIHKVKKEEQIKYMNVLHSLYNFMDRTYPDWINIDKYNILAVGSENLKAAVQNVVFDNSKVKYCKNNIPNIIKEDIFIIDLVDSLFYEDIELWKEKCRINLEKLQKNFKGRKVILIKFIEEKYKKQADAVYDSYLNSSTLNISLIENIGDRRKCNENLIWDISDMILQKLKDK